MRLANPAYGQLPGVKPQDQLPGAKVQQPTMVNPRPAMPTKDTGAPMPFTQPNMNMINGVFGAAVPNTFNRVINDEGIQNQTYI